MTAQELTTGTIIDRYEVEGMLGKGGMAAVLRVRHVDLRTRHALKVLQITVPGLHERLLQEGRIQAGLAHPNVCRVTDIVRAGGTPGLVMEIVNGPALDHLLHSYQPNLDQIDQIARGMLAGVEAAHAAGLVHRDLKPGNILLAITGDTVVPKVTDFGLAKAVDDSMSARGGLATRSGAPMGTPTFMAPEQYRNAKRADQRADVFSLGCILYELVSGLPAFDGEDLVEIYEQTASGRYRPVREVAPNIPARMEEAITRALKPDPADRPQSTTELRALWCADVPDSALSGCWESAHLELVRSLGPSKAATLRSSITMPESDPVAPSPLLAPSPPPSVATRRTPMLALGILGAGGVGMAIVGLLSAIGFGALVLRPSPEASPVAVAPEPEPDPTPVREPEPPPEPVAVPVPVPEVTAPPPAPPRLDGARIEVQGVDRAWLQGPGGSVKPGQVPPGRYSLHVFFDNASPTRVMDLDLSAGDERVVRCYRSLKVCR